jgi:hypothetical protein
MHEIVALVVPIRVVPVLAALAQQTQPSTVREVALLDALAPPEMAVSIALTLSETAALRALVLPHQQARKPMLEMPPLIALAALLGMAALIALLLQRARVSIHRARASKREMAPLIAMIALLEMEVLIVVPLLEMVAVSALSLGVPLAPLIWGIPLVWGIAWLVPGPASHPQYLARRRCCGAKR